MSGFTGYNPNKVKDLRNSINSTIAPKVKDAIINELKTGIVTPISTAWYTQEGKDYFDAFSEAVKNTGPIIEEIFNAFIKGLEIAANNWAENVQSKDRITLPNLSGLNLKLDVSAVKKDKGGDIGIDEAAATQVANNAAQVKTNVNNELRTLSKSLSATSAFLGQGQAEAVEACFTKIQDEVAKIFSFLSEDTGNGQSLKSAIKAAVEKYGDVGSKTSSYFNG